MSIFCGPPFVTVLSIPWSDLWPPPFFFFPCLMFFVPSLRFVGVDPPHWWLRCFLHLPLSFEAKLAVVSFQIPGQPYSLEFAASLAVTSVLPLARVHVHRSPPSDRQHQPHPARGAPRHLHQGRYVYYSTFLWAFEISTALILLDQCLTHFFFSVVSMGRCFVWSSFRRSNASNRHPLHSILDARQKWNFIKVVNISTAFGSLHPH